MSPLIPTTAHKVRSSSLFAELCLSERASPRLMSSACSLLRARLTGPARFRPGRRGGERTTQDLWEQPGANWKTQRSWNEGSSARIWRGEGEPRTLWSNLGLRRRTRSAGAGENARHAMRAAATRAAFCSYWPFPAGSE